MQEAFLQLVEQYGYVGVGVLLLVETVFPPIPSEAVLLFGGALTVGGRLQLFGVVLWATLGATLGAAGLYFLGRAVGLQRMEAFVQSRRGQRLGFRLQPLQQAEQWFCKRGYTAVFFCRCIPLLRSVVSVPAGIAALPFWPFLGLTAAGSYLWNTALVWLGRLAAATWQAQLQGLNRWLSFVILLLGLLTLGWLTWRFARKKRRD